MVSAKKRNWNHLNYLLAYFYSYRTYDNLVISMCLFLNFYVIREMVPTPCCPLAFLGELLKNLHAKGLNQISKGGNQALQFFRLASDCCSAQIGKQSLKVLIDKIFLAYINKVGSS